MIMVSWLRRFAGLVALMNLIFATGSPAATPPPRHFVWRVNGLPAPFYLIGSLHSLPPEDYPLPEPYRRALGQARRFVFEYSPQQRETLMRKFREAARYPSGLDIENDVRPNTVALLRKNLWKYALSFDQARHYRPWAIALQLLSKRGPLGPSYPRSMENTLISEARRSGKEMAGLETVDEHIAFWREMLERDGENLLIYTLIHDDQVGGLFARTQEAWKSGNVTALAATNLGLHRANVGIAERLLDRRNTKWVERIEVEMKTGKPTAIIAGASHFSGPQSVIALLRQRGHAIEQL